MLRDAWDDPRYINSRRTLAGLIASCLAILPLRQLFIDWAWLVDAWLAMSITLLPAAALRLRLAPRIVHLVPGLVLTVLWLTAHNVTAHATGGVLPLPGSWPYIADLVRDVGDTVRDGAAPLQSTGAIRMVLSALLVLLAVAVDLLAVIARRPALTAVPFLLIFTLSGAIPREPVGWLWFAASAAGYLLLLSSDTRDELSRWGRLMPRTSGTRSSAVQALSGRRIGVIAVVLAVCLPLVLPTRSGNVVADALHRTSNGEGDGTGNGRGVALGAFASLRGKLTRPKPVDLFSVELSSVDHEPFYLRQEVLDSFTGKGWQASDPGSTESLGDNFFTTVPATGTSSIPAQYQAKITVDQLVGNAPVFQAPSSVSGLDGRYQWNPRNQLVLGSGIRSGDSYTEDVREPQPLVADLRQAAPTTSSDVSRWLELPGPIPQQVQQLVTTLTANKAGPYDKARAISDYFSPANGFLYSLQTKTGDSGNDLVDFLTNKVGYCQQYAAAMGVMLRVADVPARVVLGYTHPKPDANGRFVVTTNDAHAWVEAYFDSAGWVPFDPTPLVGGDSARAAPLVWAPHPTASAGPSASDPNARNSNAANGQPQQSAPVAGSTRSGGSGSRLPAWPFVIAAVVVAIGLLVVSLPAAVRAGRRRRRLRAASIGSAGPDPLWAELADTAIDLGYVWSPVRSPRQVVGWLSRDGLGGDANTSLRSLAGAVETSRYAGPRAALDVEPDELVDDLRRVEDSLRAGRSRRDRLRARLTPASLGWFSRLRAPRWRGRH